MKNARLSGLWEKVNEFTRAYPLWLVHVVSGVLVGFFIGFFLKMFGRPLLYAVLILTVANYFLGYVGVIEFHPTVFLQTIGIAEMPSLETIFAAISTWVTAHVIACLSAIVGFLFGWRIG